MVIGIAVVKVVSGQERSVYCSLKRYDGILDLYHVFGEYDLFMIMQADSLAGLNSLIHGIQEQIHVIEARPYW